MSIQELVCAAAVGAAFAFGRITKSRPVPAVKEQTCTGYNAFLVDDKGKRSETYFARTDCTSLRSPTCLDGRCTYHCSTMCKCDVPRPTPEAPKKSSRPNGDGTKEEGAK